MYSDIKKRGFVELSYYNFVKIIVVVEVIIDGLLNFFKNNFL